MHPRVGLHPDLCFVDSCLNYVQGTAGIRGLLHSSHALPKQLQSVHSAVISLPRAALRKGQAVRHVCTAILPDAQPATVSATS
jgi:hypothetical protein